jgi:2,6-dihydroxypyridine 3-monooxygenase
MVRCALVDDLAGGPMRAAIIGGSLGGLTTALLLRDLGIEADIYERSPSQLVQRGAGIGLLSETARYLAHRAGVAPDRISVSTSRIQYLNRRGELIYDAAHCYRFSSWNTVFRHLLALADPRRYHLGCEMTGWTDSGPTVEVRFANHAPQHVELLVCADGVGSTARARLLPAVRPAYAGYVAWRGTVPEASLDPAVATAFDDAITYHVYANSHVLLYPIPASDGSIEPGRRQLNFVWYRNYLEGGDLEELLTDRNGTRHETSLPPGSVKDSHIAELRAVAMSRLPEKIAHVVCSATQPFVQVICDVGVPRMAFGRVCLIGDAAFAVRPHAAAGSAKAAADAWALTEAIGRQSNVVAALADWEPGQLALGRQLLERTRRIGQRSQFDGNWIPDDPELIFGLHGPGT